jgi:hypothetical protein
MDYVEIWYLGAQGHNEGVSIRRFPMLLECQLVLCYLAGFVFFGRLQNHGGQEEGEENGEEGGSVRQLGI